MSVAMKTGRFSKLMHERHVHDQAADAILLTLARPGLTAAEFDAKVASWRDMVQIRNSHEAEIRYELRQRRKELGRKKSS